jgi:hypothetical protein
VKKESAIFEVKGKRGANLENCYENLNSIPPGSVDGWMDSLSPGAINGIPGPIKSSTKILVPKKCAGTASFNHEVFYENQCSSFQNCFWNL